MRLTTLFLMAAAALTAAERFEFQREDGTSCVLYADLPEKSPFSITLIIPGSQKESSLITHNSLKPDLLAIGRAPLTLEKKGVGEGALDEKIFNAHLSLSLRLEDHLLLLKKLEEGLLPGWDGKFAILGQGDGGRIGAMLAAQSDQADALILIGSGGGWTPLQEAIYSFRSEMADQGCSPQYIHGFLVQAKQEFAQAIKTPNPDRKAFGYNYKYWESVLKTNLAEDLAKANCPIYTVNGELDERVPIESVESLAARMEDKITFRKKKKAGREILKDHQIYEEAISWLSENPENVNP